MKTVGELLRDERLKQKKTLEEVSEITKIRPAILSYVEKSEYDKLPSKTYVRGFVRSYAQALRMDTEKALAFFRREYEETSQDALPPQPIEKPEVVITPTKIMVVLGSLILVAFFIFLFFQYRQFAGRPVLLVDYPPDSLILEKALVNVSGKTDPENAIVINGEDVPVSSDGSFGVTVTLIQGINRLTVIARNSIGKETIIERQVQVVSTDQ